MTGRHHDYPIDPEQDTGDNTQLGAQIARMKYDELQNVLTGMTAELWRQATTDQEQGNVERAGALARAANKLSEAVRDIGSAWDIVAPYIAPEERSESTV